MNRKMRRDRPSRIGISRSSRLMMNFATVGSDPQ
jgi:hypothetical protein